MPVKILAALLGRELEDQCYGKCANTKKLNEMAYKNQKKNKAHNNFLRREKKYRKRLKHPRPTKEFTFPELESMIARLG